MSGVEVAGLVLGAIPLIVEFGKACKSTASAMTSAVKPKERDQQLSDFYYGFFFETVILHQQIDKIVDLLPNLSSDRKAEIKEGRQVENWTEENDVAQALKEYFVANDLAAFYIFMEKLLYLFTDLLSDKRVHLSGENKNSEQMRQTLENFVQQTANNSTASLFWDRFRFLKTEQLRSANLQRLKGWNLDMERFIDNACKAAKRKIISESVNTYPSSYLRALSRRLFSTLSQCLACQCISPHQAKFNLESCSRLLPETELRDSGLFFDFLVSQLPPQGQEKWLEGKITILAPRPITDRSKWEMSKICDAMNRTLPIPCSLQLLVEDQNPTPKMWCLNPKPGRPKYHQARPALSFESLLQLNKPSLLNRRKLATTLACSLVQLYESPWLSEHWDKGSLHFFSTDQGVLDLEHPFLDIDFDPFPTGEELSDPNLLHPNPGLLKLGILLLEIHKWQPIDAMRTTEDLVNGIPSINTDFLAAYRAFQSLNDCFPTYKSAIQACIQPPADWTPVGTRLNLEDENVWNAVYRDVVLPLIVETKLAGASSAELMALFSRPNV